jgi:hypothetical protein
MTYRRSPVRLILGTLLASAVAGHATAVELQRPSKIIQTPLNNLLIAEVGTVAAAPNSGRVSIVDRHGNRRTLIDGLPSAPTNAANTPSGPSGLYLVGRTLLVAIGEGNPTVAGPVPRTEVPNPAVSSPIFSSVLAVHFSAAVETKTTGVTLSLGDHHALKHGERLVRHDVKGRRITIELIVDFPDYISEPLPALAINVRHSHPYGVVADSDYLYVPDGGFNLVHKVDMETGDFAPLVSFPNTPNPRFPGFGPPTSENVPTSIRWDDEVLLVTVFNGFPFAAGQSQVMAVDPDTGASLPLITGLTSAIDVLPIRAGCVTVGYLTLEYSVDQLGGLPGRLQVYDAAGTAVEVLSTWLITPSSMAYDWKSGDITVAEISLGGLVVIPRSAGE